MNAPASLVDLPSCPPSQKQTATSKRATAHFEGYRFDIGVYGGIDAASIRTASAPDLGGALVVVRPHATLNDVLDKTKLISGRSSSLADKVSFYEGGGYTSCWLLNLTPDDPTKAKWVNISTRA